MAHPTFVRVFLASSSDVAAERAAFKQLADELNRGYERHRLPLRVDPGLWEESALAYCGVQVQDPINLALDDAHVVVFAFGERLGTGVRE